MKSLERAQNDLGGQPAGLVDHDAHDPTLFERRVDAMFRLLVEPPVSLFTVDAQRRVMENVTGELYNGLTYYELWMESVHQLLIEREVLTADEIEGRLTEVEERLIREYQVRQQQG